MRELFLMDRQNYNPEQSVQKTVGEGHYHEGRESAPQLCVKVQLL